VLRGFASGAGTVAKESYQDEDSIVATFGEDVRELGWLLRLNHTRLGHMLGVSPCTINNYIKKKPTKPFYYAQNVVAMKLQEAREAEYQRLKTVLGK